MMHSLSIVLPAYNEKDNLATAVSEAVRAGRLMAGEVEVIVVDDASTDGTGALADRLARDTPELKVLHHVVNRGLGGALQTGFAAATKEWVFYTDSDLPIQMDDALGAVPLTDHADAIVGWRKSRSESRRREVNSPHLQLDGSYLFRPARPGHQLRLQDLPPVVPEPHAPAGPRGRSYDAELLLELRRVGARFAEMGLDYYPRVAGRLHHRRPQGRPAHALGDDQVPGASPRQAGYGPRPPSRRTERSRGSWEVDRGSPGATGGESTDRPSPLSSIYEPRSTPPTMPPTTTLVVNADDLGLSAGINRGLERCFREGILRSASLMPNGAAWDDALEMIARNPGLGVGVHLSLVDEPALAPAAQVRGLADPEGRLPRSHQDFVHGFMRGRFGKEQIAAEVAAQLARVREAGLHPTHLDSHQHLHLLPSVLEVVIVAAREAGISMVRVPVESNAPAGSAGLARRLQLRLLGQMARQGATRLRAARFHTADHFWGLSQSGNLDETILLQIGARLGPGVNELMCHPGASDPATAERYAWGYHWDQEAAALCAPQVRELLVENSVRLCSFAEAWD